MPDRKMVMTEQYTPTINKEEIAPGVVVYKDVVPSYEQIIPYIEQVTSSGMVLWENKQIGDNVVETMSLDYPKEFKDPNNPSILFSERMSLVFAGFLAYNERDYLDEQGYGDTLHHQFMLMKYGAGNDFRVSDRNEEKEVSAMYYLNDDYEGGSVNFPELGISYQPKANELLLFPSTEKFNYSISAVTSGTKYSVVTYLEVL